MTSDLFPPFKAPDLSVAPLLVGLTGFARSGKDSLGAILVERHGFRRVAFGDVLKRVAEDMDPLLVSAEGVAPVAVGELLERHGGWEGTKDAVPVSRQWLVDLGNSLRRHIPGVEVSAAFGSPAAGERVVNTNVYHPEEIDQIRAMGGVVIRVVRPGWVPANADEAATGAHPVDVVLVNDGDLDELAVKAAELLVELGVVGGPETVRGGCVTSQALSAAA